MTRFYPPLADARAASPTPRPEMALRGGPGGRYAIPTKHKIFVGGLPDVGDAELVAYFTQFGPVADAIAMRRDGQPRGFGFVTFHTVEVFQQVLAQEHTLDGKKLALKPADGNDARAGQGRDAPPAAGARFHPYGQARQMPPQHPQSQLMHGQQMGGAGDMGGMGGMGMQQPMGMAMQGGNMQQMVS